MKLSRMANAKKAPAAPVVPPSAAHEALVKVLEDLLRTFAGTSHPLVTMIVALKAGLIRDLAEVPEERIRNACRDFADRFIFVANAGLDLPDIAEGADRALTRREDDGA